jgi:hypothetical protein
MAPLTRWEDTLIAGLDVEDKVAKEHGLVRNPDMLGTDLYHSASKMFCEIKSISSRAIEYTRDASNKVTGPKYMYLQITRKAHIRDENNMIPVLRPGGVFRTCQDSPDSMFLIRSPEKKFYDYFTSCFVAIPERTFYYRGYQLLCKLVALINTKTVSPFRLYHDSTTHAFETVVKVPFEALDDIALTKEEFTMCMERGCEGLSLETYKNLWMDVVNRYSIPCLRKVAMYKSTLDAYLSLDVAPEWRPEWFFKPIHR